MRRRRLLAVGAGLAGGVAAGCTDADPGSDDASTPVAGTDTPVSDGSATDAPSATTASDGTDLDLREANVTGVTVEARDAGEYRFSVTLIHDDEGEDGYANWWQVETLDGDRLGRRDLAHAHGTREFTRSATVAIPSGIDCVVVRGHDQRHDYGGQAAVVAIPDGQQRLIDQGREPESVDDTDCP